MPNPLHKILNSKSKQAILMHFLAHTPEYMANGRQIAEQIGVSPPATHTALKVLYQHKILHREIIGGQHLYRLNTASQFYSNVLVPMFADNIAIGKSLGKFLAKHISKHKLGSQILSIVLYGSYQTNTTHETSDVDIAIIVNDTCDNNLLADLFLNEIWPEFNKQYSKHLDSYIQNKSTFVQMFRNNKPPISTLIKSYTVLYGCDIIDLI